MYRERFHIPVQQNTQKPYIYFCGNSLGLQPKGVLEAIQQELQDWANLGVEGHFHGKNPWAKYHEFFSEKAARLVGANPVEVVMMNNLTVNLHLMMVSFYRPNPKRYKIIIEGGAFPSDQYAVKSQILFHGYKVEDALIELVPRKNEHTLRAEDIIQAIHDAGDSLAMVMLGGVNYYTGQAFDMQKITQAAHTVGAIAGFDLAHAAGNLVLHLHDWDVDFAVWCTYKYLNSGPGAVSGCFVHEKYGNNPELPRFAGWWGHDEKTRFLMGSDFVPMLGAAGWQLSNAPVMNMVAHKVSLDIFDEATMPVLRKKAEEMIQVLLERIQNHVEIITPPELKDRGCQTSIRVGKQGKAIFQKLSDAGIIADWREPDVIRIAPVPLYNTLEEIDEFAKLLKKII
jgi:kynureninase